MSEATLPDEPRFSGARVDRLGLVLNIIGFASLAAGSLVIAANPTKSYEISVLGGALSSFWICLSLSMFVGTAILFGYAARLRPLGPSRTTQFAAMTQITMVIFEATGFPLLRHYYAYGRGDVLTHLGEVRFILARGTVGPQNFYPVDHVSAAALILLTNLAIGTAAQVLAPLLSAAYPWFMFVITKRISKASGLPLVAFALSAALVFSRYHAEFYPNALGVLAFPLLVYAVLMSIGQPRVSWTCILILGMGFAILSHPLTPIVLIVTIVFLSPFVGWRIPDAPPVRSRRGGLFARLPSSVLLPIVFYTAWMSLFTVFFSTIRNTVSWISGESGTTLGAIVGTFSGARLSLTDQGLLAVELFGGVGILLLGALTVVLSRKLRVAMAKDYTSAGLLSGLATSAAGLLVVGVVTLGSPFALWFRFWYFGAVLATPVVAGLVLRFLRIRRSFQNVHAGRTNHAISGRLLARTAVVSLFVALTVPVVLPSPLILQQNQQVVRGEVEGFRWAFVSRNTSSPVTAIIVPAYRFYDFLFAPENRLLEPGIPAPLSPVGLSPNHFGLSVSTTDMMSPGTLLVVSTPDLDTYLGPWSFTGRYNEGDVIALNTSPLWSKVYGDQDATVYYRAP